MYGTGMFTGSSKYSQVAYLPWNQAEQLETRIGSLFSITYAEISQKREHEVKRQLWMRVWTVLKTPLTFSRPDSKMMAFAGRRGLIPSGESVWIIFSFMPSPI